MVLIKFGVAIIIINLVATGMDNRDCIKKKGYKGLKQYKFTRSD
jgi:hypothetical protein